MTLVKELMQPNVVSYPLTVDAQEDRVHSVQTTVIVYLRNLNAGGLTIKSGRVARGHVCE